MRLNPVRKASVRFTTSSSSLSQVIVLIDWHVSCFLGAMARTTWTVCIAAALAAFCHNAAAQSSGAWDLVLNGRAVHVNAARDWNEDNWGLGFEREFASDTPWVKLALANGF